ncbi:hypothetical protein [Hymenobacter norwichensis]|uniref:hypothetical protein n=1 Tax=Hymenobacter norwichensis TaxID=223903 RepID=UPI0003B475A4|nr:hypothetical protein [Hymenobacter norwichensis]
MPIPVSRETLESLLTRRQGSALTWWAWFRQAPAASTSRQMLQHLARLAATGLAGQPGPAGSPAWPIRRQ